MAGGTLLVSRLINWFPHFKTLFEELGFPNVHVTDTEKDGLNFMINELKPKYVLIGSNFYDCGTPYMIGQLLKVFPKLNLAIINFSPFPDAVAVWFIFHGIKFYVKWSDGKEELHHGLQCFLDRKRYIAPDVQKLIDELPEIPKVPLKPTIRQKAVLLMLYNGYSTKGIMDNLCICRATVEKHIKELLKIFNSRSREELIKTVNSLDIFSKNELCFNDSSNNIADLPDWVRTQQKIKLIKMRNV